MMPWCLNPNIGVRTLARRYWWIYVIFILVLLFRIHKNQAGKTLLIFSYTERERSKLHMELFFQRKRDRIEEKGNKMRDDDLLLATKPFISHQEANYCSCLNMKFDTSYLIDKIQILFSLGMTSGKQICQTNPTLSWCWDFLILIYYRMRGCI